MAYLNRIHYRCPKYPCHDPGKMYSCVFCWCPLYELDCEGVYSYDNNGVKDCSKCLLPHDINWYHNVLDFLQKALENLGQESKIDEDN